MVPDGLGTALKPAWEPICLARKPLDGTVAENVLAHGTGALNIDGCRIESDEVRPVHEHTGRTGDKFGAGLEGSRRTGETTTIGRWPANLVHDGSCEVVAAFPAETRTAGNVKPTTFSIGFSGAKGVDRLPIDHRDSGSAARFFYSAKADDDARIGSGHPTIKPVDLMRWLVRLVTPPGGVVLDPFAGTGTTGEAAFREGMRAILVEREERFIPDIRRRMALVKEGPAIRKAARAKAKAERKGAAADHGPLFDVSGKEAAE